MPEAPNHDDGPEEGTTDWHVPLDENSGDDDTEADVDRPDDRRDRRPVLRERERTHARPGGYVPDGHEGG